MNHSSCGDPPLNNCCCACNCRRNLWGGTMLSIAPQDNIEELKEELREIKNSLKDIKVLLEVLINGGTKKTLGILKG